MKSQHASNLETETSPPTSPSTSVSTSPPRSASTAYLPTSPSAATASPLRCSEIHSTAASTIRADAGSNAPLDGARFRAPRCWNAVGHARTAHAAHSSRSFWSFLVCWPSLLCAAFIGTTTAQTTSLSSMCNGFHAGCERVCPEDYSTSPSTFTFLVKTPSCVYDGNRSVAPYAVMRGIQAAIRTASTTTRTMTSTQVSTSTRSLTISATGSRTTVTAPARPQARSHSHPRLLPDRCPRRSQPIKNTTSTLLHSQRMRRLKCLVYEPAIWQNRARESDCRSIPLFATRNVKHRLRRQ
ncbi:hypothetical protein V8E36_002506 [Tilletia maclaganii]